MKLPRYVNTRHFDLNAIQDDSENGNFSIDNIEDYRYQNIVQASLINGQRKQAERQCDEYGLDFASEFAIFKGCNS